MKKVFIVVVSLSVLIGMCSCSPSAVAETPVIPDSYDYSVLETKSSESPGDTLGGVAKSGWEPEVPLTKSGI